MNFNLARTIEILERTPLALQTMLLNIDPEWTSTNEGGNTWSVYDVIGHLIHGEKTDWIPRIEIILSNNADKSFQKFDRFAQFEESKGKSLASLLAAFTTIRNNNLEHLRSKNISEADFMLTGIHPAFGKITLSQLLATWAVHDLNHLAQISRIMAVQYKAAVGPWVEYLKILQTS